LELFFRKQKKASAAREHIYFFATPSGVGAWMNSFIPITFI
jgi:hypothetical protein